DLRREAAGRPRHPRQRDAGVLSGPSHPGGGDRSHLRVPSPGKAPRRRGGRDERPGRHLRDLRDAGVRYPCTCGLPPAPHARGGGGQARSGRGNDAVRRLLPAGQAPPHRLRPHEIPQRLEEAPAGAEGRSQLVDSRTIERSELEGKVLAELQQIAEGLGVEGHQRLRKSDLIDAIVSAASAGNGASAADAPAASGENPKPSRNGPSRGAKANAETKANADTDPPSD